VLSGTESFASFHGRGRAKVLTFSPKKVPKKIAPLFTPSYEPRPGTMLARRRRKFFKKRPKNAYKCIVFAAPLVYDNVVPSRPPFPSVVSETSLALSGKTFYNEMRCAHFPGKLIAHNRRGTCEPADIAPLQSTRFSRI